MVAFVAGATGYVGQAVVRALVAREQKVVAHVRSDSAELDAWRLRFGQVGVSVDTTPWRADAMNATLSALRPQQVFALLGTTRARATALQTAGGDAAAASYEAVDYGRTRQLLDACTAASPTPAFIYLSSQGVHAGALGAYLAARWRLETALRASGLVAVIARPAIITGEDRAESRTGERIAATVSDAALAVLASLGMGKLRDRYGSIDADSLAWGLVEAGLSAREGCVERTADQLRPPRDGAKA
jgi:nucleoside-diphosphate-sugar epimerase